MARIVEGETFLERITGKVTIDQIKPGWLIFSEGFKSLKTKMRIKRVFDIVLSVVGLVLSSPIALLAALIIKLESKGPVIFKQVRVGEGGKEYDIFKFRSMRVDAETASGPVFAKEGDPRSTVFGRFIRKTRIDEIPQLFNTLRGDMSFVGPRPERPFFVAELKQAIPYYEVRTVVKPGITGWAQIRYSYGAGLKDAIEKLQYDIFYIKNMSILFDLIIIFKTIKVILAIKGSR
ncbi:MAG: exopolysaccharide biosynthesis polyprenyl glycosylphosphotransferase [Nitrospinota bacterium]